MDETKRDSQDKGLENLSVNSSRRSGEKEDGTGNPAREDKKRDSTESTKVPDEQMPKG
jgi:hypothetical protein